jgi:hypothetical protein
VRHLRSLIALLGGIAISVIGLGVVLDTTWELAGVALILAGVVVAARGMSLGPAGGMHGSSGLGRGWASGRSSILGWPSGLGPRLARRGSARGVARGVARREGG